MAQETKHVSFRMNENIDSMVNSLKEALGYSSNPEVFKEAVRQMYRRQFPSYSGKPTPMPVVGGGNQARATAKARVQNKVALKQEEEAEIMENGKAITRLLSGRVVNLTAGIDQVGCAYSRMDNGPKTQEMTNPILFLQMHQNGVWGDESGIETNDRLQVFLLETKFRDLHLDDHEEVVGKKLGLISRTMKTGVERGTVTAKDFSPEVLFCLFKYLDQYEIDGSELRTAMEEANFEMFE